MAAGPADVEPAREDLLEARGALERVEAGLLSSEPTALSPEERGDGPLGGLVPAPDAPPAALDRFARKLVAIEARSRERRLLAYYRMVLSPLLPGFDEATIERVGEAFASYAEATKAIPWGLVGGHAGGAAESWRQVLEHQDRLLRALLERDLPPEKVELLHGRFALRVPAPGEGLPTPRLGGTQPAAGEGGG
jgi:hypothetical protein